MPKRLRSLDEFEPPAWVRRKKARERVTPRELLMFGIVVAVGIWIGTLF